jgi:isopenicillin-N N-acyltransferase-like protein
MMNKIVLLALVGIFAFSCKKIQSTIEQNGNLTIVHLYGTPYQRGYDYGTLLKPQIEEIVEKWMKNVEQTYNQDFNSVIQLFFNSTAFVSSARHHIPDLLEEIKGISEGCGIDYETILALQMSEEIEALSDDLKAIGCTSLSINKTDSTPTLLAQNMDPPQLFHGTPVLLHISGAKNTSEKYIFTFPGLVGLCGLNSCGVGITCNGISMLNHTNTGMPVAFIVRLILEQNSEQQAYSCIENVPIAIPQCFTIGGPQMARCYECSANTREVFYPFDDKNITLHTNFSISNRDFNQKFIELLKEYGKTVDDPYFCPRFFTAYDMIIGYDYKLNLHNIKAILSSTESDLETISNENTFGCLIMELSESPILHIAPGKPDETEFITLKFK